MFLQTVSVAVRVPDHQGSRGHGRIADSVAALAIPYVRPAVSEGDAAEAVR